MRLGDDEIADLVRYVHTAVDQSRKIKIPVGFTDEIIDDFKKMAKRTRPLSADEQGIIAITKPKSAALLADRVWCMASDFNSDITFGWEVARDVRLRAILALYQLLGIDETSDEETLSEESLAKTERFLNDLERDMASDYRESTGANIVPLYNSTARRDAQYRRGDEAAIIAVVENMEIVDEKRLSWEQVTEFRQDKDAHLAYRRFIHWLDKEMVGKSAEFIADEIAIRIEKYEWALRKHGIQRIIGALSDTINPKSLIGVSGVGMTVQLIMNQPIWSLLATGGLFVGKTALSLATTFLERQDIQLAHREVAYVQEVKKKFE